MKKLLPLLLFVPFLSFGQNCKSVKKTVDDMTNTTTYRGKKIFMPSFGGLISEIEFVKTSNVYLILYSHVFWEPMRVYVDTTEKFIVKLNNGNLLNLNVVKKVSGKESLDYLTKRTFTTIEIPIALTEEQVKQIAASGIEKIRFITNDGSVDDKTNRITNKDVIELATCITQVQ